MAKVIKIITKTLIIKNKSQKLAGVLHSRLKLTQVGMIHPEFMTNLKK